GAASGIGRATAIRLARDAAGRNAAQAQILLVDIAEEKLGEVAALLRAENARVESIVVDLADESAPARVVDAAARAFGGLDGLVSNAGIIQRSSLLELSVADYERSFAINTRATWLLAKAAHPLLAASKGSLVATASISAHEPTPPLGAYSASKAALIMLVRQMALEWGPDGIRCNTVSPGSTHTAMTDARYSDPVQRAAAAQRNPLRAVGLPENQAAAIAFLLSPDAAYVTGVDLLVDGGLRTMLMPASGFGDPWRR
ncbi:MAG TPA: SDR family oxidoreductase, partial [Rhizomicrobium sp.]|nr:SDR family oxidoreductase [Rhizomicrobium sp.]